jgi:hypothetical protein
MTWAKLDDDFYGHPKVLDAWRRDRSAVGLFALSLSYSAKHELDGAVPANFIRQVLPDRDERRAAVTALLRAGLWEHNGGRGAYAIHDFLDCNPSREELDRDRAAGRRRAQKSRRQRQLEVADA